VTSGLAESALEEVCLDYLADRGWTVLHGQDIAHDGKTPERASYAAVVLEGRLRKAVARLNSHLPPAAVEDAVEAVGKAESQVLISENWRVYRLMVQGVPVEYRDASGQVKHDRAWLLDWENPETNDFLAVNQFTVVQDGRKRIPDIVCFVNGLPLALFELKAVGSENATLKGAHNQLRTYQKDIPSLFAPNAVCVITDGHQARIGTMTSPLEHFAAWKTVDGSDASPALPQMDVLVHGVFDPARFLDLVRNFIVFSDEPVGVVKRVAKYHQFWAVNEALASTIEASTTGDGRAGVVWHTQGSGKSLEMLFYAGKVMRDPAMSNPTLVLLTDRNDLDDQLFDEVFTAARTLPEKPSQAESRHDLKRLLTRASGGIVFTTLQKFGLSKDDRDAGRPFPTLTNRRNVVVIADEAHRSQYDFIDGLARNLRDALPNASFIGFTGTPIETADKNTRQVFGGYVHTYDMTKSVQDEATVKVFYEARWRRSTCPQSTSSNSTRHSSRRPRTPPTRRRRSSRPGGRKSRRSSARSSGSAR
jgi:type I restriction enzyme R subunit